MAVNVLLEPVLDPQTNEEVDSSLANLPQSADSIVVQVIVVIVRVRRGADARARAACRAAPHLQEDQLHLLLHAAVQRAGPARGRAARVHGGCGARRLHQRAHIAA